MGFVRRWLNQVQVAMSQLNVATKLLIGTLCVVILATLFLVALYAGQEDLQPVLPQALSYEDQAKMTTQLKSADIPYEVRDNRVLVPTSRYQDAWTALMTNNALPKDTSSGFDELAKQQSWHQSRTQTRQLYLIAKQNVLATVVRAIRGVKDSTVIISMPDPENLTFGKRYKRPSASVSVIMETGSVDQKLVDAVAGVVSGAVAEMQPEDVTVIDANAGRQWKVRSDDGLVAGDHMEFVQQTERMVQNKIAAALAYIPKVIVAVNVEADTKRRQINEEVYNKDESVELTTSEMIRSQTTTSSSRGGEPGVRSNTGVDIAGMTGGNGGAETKETERNFSTHPGRRVTITQDPGGVLKKINATVNVPRSYFVNIYRQSQPADAATDPTDDVLKPIIAEHTEHIKNQVQPLLVAEAEGHLWVDVYPDVVLTAGAGAVEAGMGGAAGTAGLFGQSLYMTIGLGSLAFISLGLVLWGLRNGSRQDEQVSASELAGIPPKLLTDDMVIGEADEGDAPLTGLELDENQLRTRKLTKQVSELVDSNPQEVINLVQRWVKRSD